MIWMYSAGFVRDNERVKPRAQTWSRQVNKPADICISCLTTLPFITSSHLSRRPSQLLLLPFVGAITWHYHSKHHFFLFEFQTGSSWQTWGRSWAMSVACQCSSFDGPRLVRCLIALLWQVNLSLRCSALEKCETLPGRPEWYASKNKVATQLNGSWENQGHKVKVSLSVPMGTKQPHRCYSWILCSHVTFAFRWWLKCLNFSSLLLVLQDSK